MKRIIITIAVMSAMMASAFAAGPKKIAEARVTYLTTMHCAKCAHKISENISFEKGVRDLKTDVGSKTVTIVFDMAKTDTLKLGDAIRKLGYGASVTEFKEIK